MPKPKPKIEQRPKAAKQPVLPLPKTLIETVPSSENLFNGCGFMLKYVGQIEQELKKLQNRKDPIRLARAFVVLHRLKAHLDAVNGEGGAFNRLFEEYKKRIIPETFEAAGVSNVPLTEGFRVGTTDPQMFVSIKKDMREAAYKWLADNGFESLIQPTVNSSTLSAAARKMLEDDNQELPEALFTVAMIPNTSVTQTGAKAKGS